MEFRILILEIRNFVNGNGVDKVEVSGFIG